MRKTGAMVSKSVSGAGLGAITRQGCAVVLVIMAMWISSVPALAASEGDRATAQGYVLDGAANYQSNPRRHCVPQMYEGIGRQARLEAPEGGWPSEPQAVVVFNNFQGEVMISHGGVAWCAQMFDMRTRDSRFRSGVGQVVMPQVGSREPIIVGWKTPLLGEWVPTLKLGSPVQLQYEDTARLLIRTACMAVALALALSTLMGWLAVRERPFIFYTLACVQLLVWQSLLNGLAGYPRPWFAFSDHLAQWQVSMGLVAAGTTLLGLVILSGGHRLSGRFDQVSAWVLGGIGLLACAAFLVPAGALGVLARLSQVMLYAGGLLVVMLAMVMVLRGFHRAWLGLIAVLPFLGMFVGEMIGAMWWLAYRVEVQQLAATWLLMLAAYALNRRLGLLRVQRDEMRQLADTDGLTGLPNRRAGLLRLKRLLADAREQGGVLSLAFIDVDHFKSINDSYGHEAGDQVLLAVSTLLSESFRNREDVVRMGGEEFLVLLPNVGADSAFGRLEDVRGQIGMMGLAHIAPGLRVTVSVGIAQLVSTDLDADMLLRRADRAMYQAKQKGRDRVQLA